MSVKKNIIANYFGQGWQALMSVLFVPLYIKHLGMDSYGLIGVFTLLQAWLALLDIGLKPALGREMARFTAGARDPQSIRNLLRSVESVGIAIATAVSVSVWAASGWIASHWITAKHLSPKTVAQALAVMGIVTALRFMEDIYLSSIAGLQEQVIQNILTIVMATARGLGAVCVLIWVSPTIGAFFIWQGIVSVLNVLALGRAVYWVLPPAPGRARFSRGSLAEIRNFAGGMLAITCLGVVLTQIDKVLLSRLLTLDVFGYYALAGVVAATLPTLTGPITGAFYPRFTQLVASGDILGLRSAYHQGSQMVSVLVGSGAMILIAFDFRILRLWTGNVELAQRVAPVATVLVLGALCNTLMWVPYQMQLAHGWTSLTVKINLIAVSLLVPAILVVVPIYGAIGAAWGSVAVNAAYLLFSIPLMHRRVLPTEKWRWYIEDVALPLLAAAMVAALCRWLMPPNLGKFSEIAALLFSSFSILIAATLCSPAMRNQIGRYLRRNHGYNSIRQPGSDTLAAL